MTPKEKAQQLYLKYTNALDIRDLRTTANPFAQQCALIAVNEILREFYIYDYYDDMEDRFQYFKKVKQEIEAL